MNSQNSPQPDPEPAAPDVRQSAHWLVCADIMDRAAVGQATYGVPLVVDNGRDHLADWYQEMLDAICYARIAMEEKRQNAVPLADDALAAECAARGWGVIRPTQGPEAPVEPSELPHSEIPTVDVVDLAELTSEYALRKYEAYGAWLRSGRHDEEWGDGYEAGRRDAMGTVPSPHGNDLTGADRMRSWLDGRECGKEEALGVFYFARHLAEQKDWSAQTFGPGARTQGIVAHIRKELEEILAAPGDVGEWIDVLILACDGAWRTGATPSEIIGALQYKAATNQAQTWPDWRTLPQDQPSEHMRDKEESMLPGKGSAEHRAWMDGVTMGRQTVSPLPAPLASIEADEEDMPTVLDVCLTYELAREATHPWSFQHVRERLGELGIPLEGLWGDHSAEVGRREPRWRAAEDTTQEVAR